MRAARLAQAFCGTACPPPAPGSAPLEHHHHATFLTNRNNIRPIGQRTVWLMGCAGLCLSLSGCFAERAEVVVVPGRSVAGVELGMSRDRVISVLGKPTKEISSQDIGQMGQFRVLGEGPFTGEMPRMTVLVYSHPPLFVSLHEDDKVGAIQLGYTESVRVEGYDFLQFKYLAKEELERIGKPSSMVRDEASERQMLSMAPEGTKIEYYVYDYDHLGMKLGLIFEKSREHSSKYFINVNYIQVGVNDILAGEIVP